MATIRRAAPSDVDALNRLMHDSSAYSGSYATILQGYAITVAQVGSDRIYLAETGDSALLGFYSLTLVPEPELDLIFVADGTQGSGLGRDLFDHMRSVATDLGVDAVKIVSHPPSVGFYERMGAVRVGTKAPTPTAAWERPILSLPVGSRSNHR